jgi:hypothetical protein
MCVFGCTVSLHKVASDIHFGQAHIFKSVLRFCCDCSHSTCLSAFSGDLRSAQPRNQLLADAFSGE